jgi:hypothetical protein
MSKQATSTFIHEFKLKTNKFQERKLNIKFNCLRELYNNVLSECFHRLRQLRNDPQYTVACDLLKSKNKKDATKIFNELNEKYQFKKNYLQTFATKIKNNTYIKDHLDGDTIQVISDRAFESVNDYRYGKRGKPRFKLWKNALKSISGKKNACIFFKKGKVKWKELFIDVVFDKKDKHGIETHALNQKIKYCRIKRRFINGKFSYYLQLSLSGKPKLKYVSPNKEVGIDIGVSTIAAVSKEKAILKPFCHDLEPMQIEIKTLQRKISRSLRLNNPNNFDENGKTLKGKRKWFKTKRYLKLENELKELYRKQVDKRQYLHNCLANDVLKLGKIINIETNNYKAWQKGWFGKTIGFRAPSNFVTTLHRKAESADGEWNEINPFENKLSQLCHVCDKYTKKTLAIRTHNCCKITQQRDLYSASLALYYDPKKEYVNTSSLRNEYKSLDTVLKTAVLTLEKLRIVGYIPTSLGLRKPEKEQFAVENSCGSLVRSVA